MQYKIYFVWFTEDTRSEIKQYIKRKRESEREKGRDRESEGE